METLQLQLFEAAAKGNVSSLQQLLTVDPLLLDRVTPNYNSETALHVSALLGHLDFVKQIIGIKPELTNELNSQGSTPLHLASAKGHADVVRELLSVVGRETTCLARDKDGLTPLHLAAMKGRVAVMELLLGARPEAARLTWYGGETILHLCVRNWRLEALKLLVSSVGDPEFVKSKDGGGNTLLHLAVEYKQVEIINLLVNNGTGTDQVDVNAVNNKGLTAMDVLNRSRSDVRDSEISESLKRGAGAGAGAGASILADKRVDDKNWFAKHLQETTNALMVVASVIAALASQIAVNPPGGVWQDDNYLFDKDGNTVDPLGNRISHAVDSQNKSVLYPHRAGYSILATNDIALFTYLCNFNAAAFYSSIFIIFLVITGFPSTYIFFQFILMLASFIALLMAMETFNTAAVSWIPLTEYQKNIVDAENYHIIGPPMYLDILLFLIAICLLWAWTPPFLGRCKAARSAVPENNNSVV